MKLIVALGIGSPAGRALREVAQDRWWEWVARVYYSASYRQYVYAYKNREGVAQLIDEPALADWVNLAKIREELHRRKLMRKVSPEELELAARVAQAMWTDALWGYTLGGWTIDSTADAVYVQQTYGVYWETVSLQSPREYVMLEQWLAQLVADAILFEKSSSC